MQTLRSVVQAATCNSDADAWVVAGVAGVAGLVSQLLISTLLRRLGTGKVKSSAGFLAHQLTALVFMVVLFVVGVSSWATLELPSSWERVYVANGVARWLAAVALG
jgi:hypothetical protein